MLFDLMVFDGTEPVRDFLPDVIGADFLGIALGRFQGYLEEAHGVYQKAYEIIPGFDKAAENGHVCFIGHSLGGSLASSLSAGIYLNAFDDGGKFDKSRYQRENPEPFGEVNIPALTFNSPQMGWFFEKKISIPLGPDAFSREERLSEVNVTHVRMNGDWVSDIRNSPYNTIGKTPEVLGAFGELGGRLEAYFKQFGVYPYYVNDAANWHSTNTLELALMEKVTEEEEEPKEPDPPQVRVDPLILDLNQDGKVSTL